MRIGKILPLMATIAILVISCAKEDSLEATTPTSAPKATEITIPQTSSIESEILDLVNDYRAENGLSILNKEENIKEEAYLHNLYMVSLGKATHNNFLARKESISTKTGASAVSENVAFGYSSAKSVVAAWTRSTSHKANMEGEHTAFNVAVTANEDGKNYYTLIFIKKS